MNNELDPSLPLVTIEWLSKNYTNPKVVILDASLPKPATQLQVIESPMRIKNAVFFDIENLFSDASSGLPHTMPSPEAFTKEVQKLGINKDSIIIAYDTYGVYSSPRAWWMFRAMGHTNVWVLNGGLPAWQNAGLECEPIIPKSIKPGNFMAHLKSDLIKNSKQVLDAITNKNQLVIDARSYERFVGKAPEPREGLRLGHIPNSINIPFTRIVKDNLMLDKKELEKIYGDVVAKNKELIFSCGSGVTACITALGAVVAGYDSISVYDGSWSEWGRPSSLPIE